MKKDPMLGDDPYEWRRYIQRWCHMETAYKEGEQARRRAAKLERDLRTAVRPPLRPPLALAPRYAGGRCRHV
jgi:hypothetical protein